MGAGEGDAIAVFGRAVGGLTRTARGGLVLLLACGVGLLVDASAPPPSRGCAAPGSCRGVIRLPGGWRLAYYRDRPLTGSATVTRAVVVVHGDNRKPRDDLDSVLRAATAAGLGDQTVVVAPFFPTPADHPGPSEARWTHRGWMQGDDAVAPAGLSSFAVLDQVLRDLADERRFPRLTEIVVAGHSAGGQFTQRYSAGGRAPSELTGVRIDFVVANPSSYLYFTRVRPAAAATFALPTTFAVPATPCAYDTYPRVVGQRSGSVDVAK